MKWRETDRQTVFHLLVHTQIVTKAKAKLVMS